MIMELVHRRWHALRLAIARQRPATLAIMPRRWRHQADLPVEPHRHLKVDRPTAPWPHTRTRLPLSLRQLLGAACPSCQGLGCVTCAGTGLT